MIRLQQLASFLVLAEELHFGHAAQRLHFTQPTLSEQIRGLEHELGVELLERSSRKVALTQAGKTLVTEGRRAMAQLDHALDATVRAARGELGRLSIVGTSSAVVGVLPQAIRAFRERYPDVVIDLVESGIVGAIDALLGDRADLALVRTPIPTRAELETLVLLEERWVAVLPNDHRMADADAVAPEELTGEPFLFFERFNNPLMYDELVTYCAPSGGGTRDVANFSTLQALVASGLGFSLQPPSIAPMTRRDVVLKPLRDPGITSRLVAVWRPGDSSTVRGAFLDTTREIVANLSGGT